MRIIPFENASSCLTLHLLLELMNETGGHVRSRLVSEEDIELDFLCPNVREDITVGYQSGPITLFPGDTLSVRWQLHITKDGPMSPEFGQRFQKPRP